MRMYQVSVSYKPKDSTYRRNKLWRVVTSDLTTAIALAKHAWRNEDGVIIWDITHQGPVDFIDPTLDTEK